MLHAGATPTSPGGFGSRKRHRPERSHEPPGDHGATTTTNSSSSAFLESFYHDQHLKRMKLNDESAAVVTPPAAAPPPALPPHGPSPSTSSLTTTTTAASSSSSSALSPEECIAKSSANHVILVDLDAWGRTLFDIVASRPLPATAFLYGFSSCSASAYSSFDAMLSSNSQASDYFGQLCARGQSLLHRQPEFGVAMTLRYQAGRLDVLLDVGTSLTLLAGAQVGGVEEIRKQFAFNEMRNRRNIALFDPKHFSRSELAQRITAHANCNQLAPAGVEGASSQQSQHQPIVIDP